jgi:hypothetical protein
MMQHNTPLHQSDVYTMQTAALFAYQDITLLLLLLLLPSLFCCQLLQLQGWLLTGAVTCCKHNERNSMLWQLRMYNMFGCNSRWRLMRRRCGRGPALSPSLPI